MALHIGLITAHARLDWHAGRLARALGALGTVEVVDPSKLRVVCGRHDGRDVLQLLADGRDARRFDAAVLGRVAGPLADQDLQLDAGRAFELLGVPVLNRVGPMLAARDKLWTAAVLASAGVPTPLCTGVPRARDVREALAQTGDAVCKPLMGSLGEGMFRCGPRRGRTTVERAVRREGCLLQRFVQPGGVDWRLFVVGDGVEACIRREAPPGEFRSNAARGARVFAAVAPRAWRDAAVAAARALGLEVAGVDLALEQGRPMVLEVNGFANFRAVQRATGRDMAEAIARRVAQLVREARSGGRKGAQRSRGLQRGAQ